MKGVAMYFKKINFISFSYQKVHGVKCPDCGSSDDIIRYDGGYMCRDCGCEW